MLRTSDVQMRVPNGCGCAGTGGLMAEAGGERRLSQSAERVEGQLASRIVVGAQIRIASCYDAKLSILLAMSRVEVLAVVLGHLLP